MNGSLMNVWRDMISVTGSFSAALILFIHQHGLNAGGSMLVKNTNGTKREHTWLPRFFLAKV